MIITMAPSCAVLSSALSQLFWRLLLDGHPEKEESAKHTKGWRITSFLNSVILLHVCYYQSVFITNTSEYPHLKTQF